VCKSGNVKPDHVGVASNVLPPAPDVERRKAISL
jgi:hypothetical protein